MENIKKEEIILWRFVQRTPSVWWQLKLQTTGIVDKHNTMEPICFKIGISLIINVCLKVKSEVMIN